jgi:hypothetical protein
MLCPLGWADVKPGLALLPGRDCSVPDCFLRPMSALSRVSDGPIFTLHGSIDRFKELRLLWLKDRRRAIRLRKSFTMHILQLLGSRFRKFCSVERADWESRWQ